MLSVVHVNVIVAISSSFEIWMFGNTEHKLKTFLLSNVFYFYSKIYYSYRIFFIFHCALETCHGIKVYHAYRNAIYELNSWYLYVSANKKQNSLPYLSCWSNLVWCILYEKLIFSGIAIIQWFEIPIHGYHN